MIIQLSAAEAQFAQLLDNRIEARLKGGGGNYTNFEMPNRWRGGYCGEFSVLQWVDTTPLKWLYQLSTDGSRKSSEFQIADSRGVYRRFEVKTSLNPNPPGYFQMPAQQAIDFDFIIGCQQLEYSASGATVRIGGWLSREEFLEAHTWFTYDDGNTKRRCEFSEMRSIETLNHYRKPTAKKAPRLEPAEPAGRLGTTSEQTDIWPDELKAWVDDYKKRDAEIKARGGV